MDTLTSASRLGTLQYLKGELEAAEPLLRRALRGREEALGKAHPRTLQSASNLAVLLDAQGRPAEAAALRAGAIAQRGPPPAGGGGGPRG